MKEQQIVWEGCFQSSTEFVSVKTNEAITVNGYITGVEDGKPYYIHYLLKTDATWIVESILIEVESDVAYVLEFKKDNNEGWKDKENLQISELADCIDIDISLTPFTNTLPINRLKLEVAESKEISVLYFKLPEGKFKKAQQRYTNIDGRFYKFEGLDSGYTTVFEIDNFGFVVNYPGLWQRVYHSGL
jgi:uncharacterized protein